MARFPTAITFLARGLLAATLCVCGGSICARSDGHAFRVVPAASSGPGVHAFHLVESDDEPATLPAIYRCPTCLRWWPWCIGAADDAPEICDDCWCDGSPEASRV